MHIFNTRFPYTPLEVKNLKLLLSDAESSPGNHITHPHSGVPGADGTTGWGRCARVGEIFMNLRFRE